MIKPKIESTLTLAIFGVLIAIVLALPAGVLSALFRGSWFDQFVRTISAAGMAVPAFWLGIIILLILSRIFGWMATVIHSTIFDNPIEAFQRYLFPSLILGFRSAAVISRMVRSMMLEVLSEDYVRTAWAKGLQPRSKEASIIFFGILSRDVKVGIIIKGKSMITSVIITEF